MIVISRNKEFDKQRPLILYMRMNVHSILYSNQHEVMDFLQIDNTKREREREIKMKLKWMTFTAVLFT